MLDRLAGERRGVGANAVKQHGLDARAFRANDIDAVNIAHIDGLLWSRFGFVERELKNARIRFFHANVVRVNDDLEKFSDAATIED